MDRVFSYTISILLSIVAPWPVLAETTTSTDGGRWLSLITYVVSAFGLLIVGNWSSDAFGRSTAEVRNRKIPARFLARRNQFVLGTGTYVLGCMILFAIIAYFH